MGACPICQSGWIPPQLLLPLNFLFGVALESGNLSEKRRYSLQSPHQCSAQQIPVGQSIRWASHLFVLLETRGGSLNVSPLTVIISSLGLIFHKTVWKAIWLQAMCAFSRANILEARGTKQSGKFFFSLSWASLVAQLVKNLPQIQETSV